MAVFIFWILYEFFVFHILVAHCYINRKMYWLIINYIILIIHIGFIIANVVLILWLKIEYILYIVIYCMSIEFPRHLNP